MPGSGATIAHPRLTKIAMKAALALALLLLMPFPDRAAAAATTDAEHYLDAFVDRSVDPRDDFFQFAVGRWLKEHPIPANERAWGIDQAVQEETYARLLRINEDAAAQGERAPAGSSARRIGDFWRAASDADAVAAQGLHPLDDEFARIEAIDSRDALVREIARLQRIGVNALCAVYIFQDLKQSDRHALYLYQGGLGLPNRDYYVDDDARATALRSAYVEHVGNVLVLLGASAQAARRDAAGVMAIETELARASRKLEALRDVEANYNPVAFDKLAGLAPQIAWRDYFAGRGLPLLDLVVVGQPEFFVQAGKSLERRPLADWKAYLRWHLAHAYAALAGGAFEAENFRFFGTVLTGTPEQRPRWKRMLDQEEKVLGDALGQLYVAAHFRPEAKTRYEKLADDVIDAFRTRLGKLDWMSEPTRRRALVKLDGLKKKIGYPDKWKDYAGYEVTPRSLLENVKRGRAWQTDYEIAKLGKPVDRSEWEMTPQTYNAYYMAPNNEIVLPAAAFILPGIDEAAVDDALVYGYAGGATIGHEITHGFDDQGRQFDEHGNLASWWADADNVEFKRRARVVVEQYSGYVVTGELRVNGEATQGENIADLGGIALAWDAFTRTAQYRDGKPLGGFTPAQRFYIGWALGWMGQARPEALALQVKTDFHSPRMVRVVGPVSNQAEFHAAFGVRPGDRMFRAEAARAKVW
jgi:putative endopeptidase